MHGMRLGIDFGTTHTVVACADRGNYPVLSFQDDEGDSHDFIPTLVAEREGVLRYGWDAVRVLADPSFTPPFTAVRSFKRWLAEPNALPTRRVRVGSIEIGLGELITGFLGWVKDAILTRSNAPEELVLEGEAAIRSVVAVPANASGAQRLLTLDAFRRAGFAPVAMLNEPSAAGFEYTHRHRDTLSKKRDHVVVYDLGGGTFDASLVRMRGKSHEVVTTAGVNQLGGDDFDGLLVDLVLARAKLARADLPEHARARLHDACREAKERLGPSSRKVTIDLEAALGDLAPMAEAAVSTSEFYDACGPLVERTIETMVPVMTRLDAEGAPPGHHADIAGIYVVGGASELPLVARALRSRFGRKVHRSPYPGAAIAIGLAIACDEAAGFELQDRFSRTFGVFREGDAGRAIVFDPIFTPGTSLPPRAGEPLRLTRGYRAAHNVGHFRFLECSAIDDGGHPRGDIVVSGDVLFPFDPALTPDALLAVPVQRLPARGPRVQEEYALDDAGIVSVTIRDLDTGRERLFRLGAG
jgi:molecular chaperone DnaK (HSP70)